MAQKIGINWARSSAVRFSQAQFDKLEQLAIMRGSSISEVVRSIIDTYPFEDELAVVSQQKPSSNKLPEGLRHSTQQPVVA